MAILKHIKSRNANYSNAIDYLLFQHDESTGKKIKDEMGRSLLRDEFYMNGLNCDPMSFDKECSLTNAKFHKNKKSSEIKSHHYIISFDPDDKSEYGLTGEKAQELCLNLAQKIFPGYQALKDSPTRTVFVSVTVSVLLSVSKLYCASNKACNSSLISSNFQSPYFAVR